MSPGQHAWPFTVPHAHSQPFALLPSQSPKPAMHVVNTQAPAVHATLLALTTLSQRFEQEPQWATSERMFVSQPVLPLSQWAKPLAHVQLHVPVAHVGVPLLAAHAVPQPPHDSGSAWVSTQSPWQHDPVAHGFPGGSQLSTHVPLGLHDLPPVHWSLVTHCTH
jgi:hypothetical protein